MELLPSLRTGDSPRTGDDFARQLQQHRTRRRLTQTELADLSAVSVRALRNLEKGQVAVPRTDTVRLLSDALRLTAHERAEFEVAAGCQSGDALFESLVEAPPAKPLLGRERETEVLHRLLAGEHRGITAITGFAGVGKTHLAAAVATRLRARGVPTLWAGPAAAGAARPGQPAGRVTELLASGEEGFGELARLVGERAALLVVDGNDRGPIPREQLRSLARLCPNLRILETSRAPQGAVEEFHLPLQPLGAAAEGGEGLPTREAEALLVQLIADRQPGFAPGPAVMPLLSEVCRRLDGVPRALEAAASWSMIASLDELLTMAREEPLLLATHPGSPAGLGLAVHEAVAVQPPSHRELLARLASRPGPWTVEAVAATLGRTRTETAAAVYRLVQCGLIRKTAAATGARSELAVLHAVRAYLANPVVPV
ncbi:hypothetical protein CFP65_2631 [Kitasatospora sp. MMS16-BH015]|uniref:helix-turn-helix domain-containing protein n=1 Tax=Kitasatospora sp. MMS16-BH015 TaxID=2018025 RepID=UPI000CA1A3C6|nr:helix-turn-helix domain-containing protein [Kitasatospora sp. MMS16-BH015]AUG77456.1 hypothetical protein CFP65_2631 [Kitasatospora sp. MMS16-BH015]